MKSTYQIHNYPLNFSSNADTQPSNYPRSPRQQPTYILHKSPINLNHHDHNSPSSLQSDHSKRFAASIKTLEEKVQNVQALVRKKPVKVQIKPNSKPDNQSATLLQQRNQPATEQKKDQQPQLRTSCPNLFKKFEQSSLRNTTHIKNLSKLNNIIADIKKQQSTTDTTNNGRGMKKNQHSYYQPLSPKYQPFTPKYQPLTPQYKKMEIKTNFKSLNQIWNHKVNIDKPKPTDTLKVSINGFELSKQLGKGKFGQVYLARHLETGAIFALKKIIKNKVKQYKMVNQFKAQIRLHSCLEHPNIVKFYGFFEENEHIYLILEYVNGGTLFDYMIEKDILDISQAVQYLKDIIQALTYMHDRSIAHRDIKPQNIVLTSEGVAKLCDFGWSALVQTSRKTYCGTFDYAPPQILQRKQYDTSVDLWCIGVLTYQILTGRVPFEGEKRKEVIEKILSVDKNKIDYPVSIPEEAKDFIEMLVQRDPQKRPRCKNLLKHSLFTKYLKTMKTKK